jgi:ABC-type Zn uptake system ZnuABC Zn-binding protein ZnuA
VRWVWVILLIVLAAAALLAFGTGSQRQTEAARGTQALPVVATIFPLADWLREVGGDDVEVHCLVSGGSNPHHFEPTIRDAAAVGRARALFAVGLGLDEWAERLARNSERGAALAFFETGSWIRPRPFNKHDLSAVADGAPEAEHRAQGVEVALVEGHAHGQYDPHYWLDPQRAAAVVARMAEELSKLDAPHAEAYRRRAAAYIEKLNALDREIAECAKTIPPGSRIVTFHDAYGYLLERLGITVAAVIQVSPGVEPSARDVAEAIRAMRQIGQHTVFHEPMDSGVAARSIAGELSARLEVLDPLDSEASSTGTTYLERMRRNANVLVEAVKPAEAR